MSYSRFDSQPLAQLADTELSGWRSLAFQEQDERIRTHRISRVQTPAEWLAQQSR